MGVDSGYGVKKPVSRKTGKPGGYMIKEKGKPSTKKPGNGPVLKDRGFIKLPIGRKPAPGKGPGRRKGPNKSRLGRGL